MSSAVFSSFPAASTAGPAQALPPSAAASRERISPESLHPDLWLGHQLGRHAEHAVPSGFAALDNSSMRALQLTRLAPLPAAFENPTLTVHLRFDYTR